MRTQTSSGSTDIEDVLASNAGAQDALATFTAATDWYAATAVFYRYGSGDTQPPTIPTGLMATSVTSGSVALSWNAATDEVGVTGYSVYRNGAALGSVSSATSYADSTVAPSKTYSYTVDAFDTAGNHSPQSAPLQIMTPAAAHWVQGGTVTTGGRVTSVSIQLNGSVGAGDLLVGWFGQYDSSGQVRVSDNVNGPWKRSSGPTTFSNGGGDIALFYVQNAASAANGLTVTIAAPAPTYLQGSTADYTGVALSNSLDQALVTEGSSTSADSGPLFVVAPGELVFSSLMTGSSPDGATANTGMAIRNHTAGFSVADADLTATVAGSQDASWTLQSPADWYEVAAVFRAAAGP
jgi:hypothetical protein